MVVTKSAGTNTLVVSFLNRGEGNVFPLADLRDSLQDFFVLLVVGGSPDYDGNIHRIDHFLDHLGFLFCAPVHAVGIDALHLKHDQLCPVLFDALLCPGLG
jgi:hypothetical protein